VENKNGGQSGRTGPLIIERERRIATVRPKQLLKHFKARKPCGRHFELFWTGLYQKVQQATGVKLTLPAQVVFAQLCSSVGDNECAWPSLATLAANVGISERTVERAITQLKQAELIWVERTNRHKACHYFIRQHPWMEIEHVTVVPPSSKSKPNESREVSPVNRCGPQVQTFERRFEIELHPSAENISTARGVTLDEMKARWPWAEEKLCAAFIAWNEATDFWPKDWASSFRKGTSKYGGECFRIWRERALQAWGPNVPRGTNL
jgi:AraC-like DNA-binding protein